MCFDNGVESEKSLGQLKEKWRALLGKYKSVCDNNNRTGRERKTFKHSEVIDEFMASSDKVNPRFVKETKAHKQDCSSEQVRDELVNVNKMPTNRQGSVVESAFFGVFSQKKLLDCYIYGGLSNNKQENH